MPVLQVKPPIPLPAGCQMIPKATLSFRPSLAALTILLASLLLAGALGALTWRSLRREEHLMENSLRREGLTLIQAVEAGARTSMMMNWQGASLPTLIRQLARGKPVAYIALTDGAGRALAAAGSWSGPSGLPVGKVLAAKGPLSRRVQAGGGRTIFEVAKRFTPGELNPDGAKGQTCGMGGMGCSPSSPGGPGRLRAIYVGLDTAGFATARAADVRQGLLMLGVLFLVGSAGFYLLFLAQNNRVARATLANMELYTRNVIESMPAGLISLDEQERVVALNRRSREIFAADAGQGEGIALNQLVDAEHCALVPLLREREEFLELPLECRRPGGEAIPLKVSASRLRDGTGRPLGTVLILRDMREIRAMEEALERSRRLAALGRMAAGIAHEIRNPLGTLRGFAQFFARRNGEDATAREYAELMVGEVDRLNRTISALLQFARPREPEFAAVDLADLLQRTGRLLEEEMATHDIAFRLEIPDPTVLFPADPDLLTQVLLNLLQNALGANEKGGEIRLGGSSAGGEVRLWVHDKGRGMNAEEREKMFDPFFTTRREGTGLGLAVVQQIVEQHRGSIEVETTPGEGTRIEIRLPATGDPEPESETT